MKTKPQKMVALTVLQETARELTRVALQDFIIPEEIRDKIVLGTFFDEDARIFELYIPGDKPSDAQVISRVRLNTQTGEAEGPVEVFNLQSRSVG